MDETQGEGWLMFAAVVLIFEGIMRVFDAFWAFRYHGALPDGLQNALLGSTLKHYGWWYLLVALVLILGGVAVLSRSQLGRWVGIIAAVIGGLSAMAWMPYYPVWSVTYVAIAVLVFYALVAHGSRGATAPAASNAQTIDVRTPKVSPTNVASTDVPSANV
jgi:hypothetical protein